MLGHPHGFLGVLDRMPVDFLDDVALLETGFGSGRVGLDLGDDHTFNVLRDLELLPGLLEKKGSPIAWVIWGVDSDSSIVWDAGMPRKLRMEYPGAMYHVMSRGDWRERIFLDDVDREEAQDRRLSYPWSSFGAYLAAPEHRPGWVRVDRLLGEHGIQEDTPASRAQFEQWMERRRLEETDREALKVLRRGWCRGGAGFRREMLLRMEGQLGEHHWGELHRSRATGHMTKGAARNDPSYGLVLPVGNGRPKAGT